MRRLILIALIAGLTSPALARNTNVKPHVRKDGTYVSGHVRTTPNRTKLDNYSTSPNVNPRTGKTGTVDPFAIPKPRSRY